MEQKQLPEGWKRIVDDSGQVCYTTRAPVVKITKKSQLDSFHKRGRYKEMRSEDLDFGKKRREKKYVSIKNEDTSNVIDLDDSQEEIVEIESGYNNNTTEDRVTCLDNPEQGKCSMEEGHAFFADSAREIIDNVQMEEEENVTELKNTEDFTKTCKITAERIKLENAVKKLTLKDEPLDHKKVLLKTAHNLNKRRKCQEQSNLDFLNFAELKEKIGETKHCEELILLLNSNALIQRRLSIISQSRILEQMLKISSNPDNPLKEFPLDINRNHYSEIVDFAMEHAPDILDLIVKLSIDNEAPVTESDVIRCAYIFSTLACTVSRTNNALKKTKSVSTKSHGMTNDGLDILANTGVFETSRNFRNDRDFLASLDESILKSYARVSVPQLTFDNMDMCIGHVLHQMTLSFLEFETLDTSHLDTEDEGFEKALGYFSQDTVLITSEFNKQLFDHYQQVVCWTLGRLFGDEVEGFAWFNRVFPKHYKHDNSETSARKSTIFTQKPLNYCENNNRDMLKIMEHIQQQYLNLVGEQSKDKEAFKKDMNIIYSADALKVVREEAELRIKEQVKMAGVAILHGDLLTDVRFETCKRLRRMAISAVERFDFLVYFRLGTFHMGMNKVIQDIQAGIKSEVNIEDSLSLGYFKTTLGLHHITNKADAIKKDGNFEYHAQFIEDIGTELLVEAFKHYVENYDVSIVESNDGAVKLLLGFLKNLDIKYYYDPDNYEEANPYDDMMSSCKDNAGRALISLIQTSVEHEGDGLGLRALRTVMMTYFLNRKENLQDSKYAPRLLFNRIWYLQASQRTKVRMDHLACCNPSGKPGRSIARDQQNEHKVKSTKAVLSGLHSQLGVLTVEKAVTGSNILEIIDGHDRQAMMMAEQGGKSSYRYLSRDQRLKIRGDISKMKPFSYDREKVEYFEKPRSVFSGLSLEQIDRFLERNKNNFRRNSPHKASVAVKKVLDGVDLEKISSEVVESGECESNGFAMELDDVMIGDVLQDELNMDMEVTSLES